MKRDALWLQLTVIKQNITIAKCKSAIIQYMLYGVKMKKVSLLVCPQQNNVSPVLLNNVNSLKII